MFRKLCILTHTHVSACSHMVRRQARKSERLVKNLTAMLSHATQRQYDNRTFFFWKSLPLAMSVHRTILENASSRICLWCRPKNAFSRQRNAADALHACTHALIWALSAPSATSCSLLSHGAKSRIATKPHLKLRSLLLQCNPIASFCIIISFAVISRNSRKARANNLVLPTRKEALNNTGNLVNFCLHTAFKTHTEQQQASMKGFTSRQEGLKIVE